MSQEDKTLPFDGFSSPVSGFESSWQTDIQSSENSAQTANLELSDKHTSTATSRSVEVQTMEAAAPAMAEVDFDRLATWLKRIYPQVIDALDCADESHAFEVYKPETEKKEEPVKLLYHLKQPDKDENKHPTHVTSISWNSTGKTLAVAYCYNHDSWCLHYHVCVHLYPVDRHGHYNDTCSKLLVPSCITALQYHPTEPSVLVAGSVTGHIYLWNMALPPTDWLVCTTVGHTEAIKQIMWHRLQDSKEYIVISSGLDAGFITWNVDIQQGTIQVKERYKINLPDLVDRPIIKGERGVRCFDFHPRHADDFVVGVEGGSVLRCSLNGAKPLALTSDNLTFLNPVISKYDGHEGDVQCVCFSPHRPDLFLSCGPDGDVHIYNINQKSVVQMIFSKEILNNIYWVPKDERMLIGCGQNGQLKPFSLINGRLLTGPEAYGKNPLTCLAFNDKSPNMVSVGDAEGFVQIWHMPWAQISEKYNL